MTRQEAMELAEGKPVSNRSCWNCNGAHEHLKQVTDSVIFCLWGCGNAYYNGVLIHEAERG